MFWWYTYYAVNLYHGSAACSPVMALNTSYSVLISQRFLKNLLMLRMSRIRNWSARGWSRVTD